MIPDHQSKFDLYIGHGDSCEVVSTDAGARMVTAVEALYCNYYEADTQMILHALHAAGESDVVLHSPDSEFM